MNEFVYDEENSLYYNWFMLKSLILFPESHKKQRKTFSYLYYRFVLTHREDRNYRLNRVPLKRIANNLNALITQRNFLNSLAERRSTIQAAGIGGETHVLDGILQLLRT